MIGDMSVLSSRMLQRKDEGFGAMLFDSLGLRPVFSQAIELEVASELCFRPGES